MLPQVDDRPDLHKAIVDTYPALVHPCGWMQGFDRCIEQIRSMQRICSALSAHRESQKVPILESNKLSRFNQPPKLVKNFVLRHIASFLRINCAKYMLILCPSRDFLYWILIIHHFLIYVKCSLLYTLFLPYVGTFLLLF